MAALCKSSYRGVTYRQPMRSAKVEMLCRWICWCDMEIFYLWANGDVVHSCTTRPWTWLDLWADYGAFLLHGDLRQLVETFVPRHVCLLGCSLEMTHGAHDDMRLWLSGLHIMVELEDLMHWGAKVRSFDAGWCEYNWVYVWVCLKEWLDEEDWYEMLWRDGVAGMMMPWWKNLGMGWADT